MVVVGGNAINHAVAYAGLGYTFEDHNIVTRYNASSSVTIPFGKGVVTDTTTGVPATAARLPVAADSNSAAINGIVFYALNRAYQEGQRFGAVPGRDMDVWTHGEIWVVAQVAVAKDDPVFLITNDGGATSNEGDFINVASSGNYTGLAYTNAKFTSAATAAGQLVRISIGIGG